MPKQNARALLVKYKPASATEFEPLAGLTTRNISLNGNLVDITSINTADPGGTVWRETIAGIQSMDVSGNGYFESKTQFQALIDAKNDGTTLDLQITIPGLGDFTGDFAVGTVGLGGELEGAITQTVELQSTGAITFTAETP